MANDSSNLMKIRDRAELRLIPGPKCLHVKWLELLLNLNLEQIFFLRIINLRFENCQDLENTESLKTGNKLCGFLVCVRFDLV